MGLTNFPGGISSFGIPVLPGLDRPYTGNVFFVCNASGYNGSDNNDGTRPDRPLSTLAKAITLATASNDDVIYVMKGHAETHRGGGDDRVLESGRLDHRPRQRAGASDVHVVDVDLGDVDDLGGQRDDQELRLRRDRHRRAGDDVRGDRR
jgi:hypothetical protein